MAETITVHTPMEGFTGEVVGVKFADGTAEVPSDAVQQLGYFRRRGYGIGEPVEQTEPAETEHAPSEPQQVGTQLRDAAVDPQPGDGPADEVEPPAGNASTDEWRAYAESLGIDVDDDAGRKAIKQAVEDAS